MTALPKCVPSLELLWRAAKASGPVLPCPVIVRVDCHLLPHPSLLESCAVDSTAELERLSKFTRLKALNVCVNRHRTRSAPIGVGYKPLFTQVSHCQIERNLI